MATSPALRWKITTVPKTPAYVRWLLNTTSGHAGDYLRFTLTLQNQVAARIGGVGLPSTNRQIGIKIEMDLGDGALTLIKGSELDGSIQYTGTLDGYGTRSLSFSRYGADQNPVKSSLLRGMSAVRFTLYRGLVGNVGAKVMLNGYLSQASYLAFPPLAQIQCADESVMHADKRLAFNLDAGSKVSRQSVLQQICNAASIPIGLWELPFPFKGVFGDAIVPGGLPGGTVYKAISEGGNRSILEFIAAFIEPLGCRMYWRDGLLNIKRFDMSGPVVATLGGGDIRSLKVDPPVPNVLNSAQYSSSIFAYTGPTGLRTTPTQSVSTSAIYAPLVAVSKQDHTSGTITATGLSSAAASRVVSRVDTTTTWDGGTIVSQIVEEYGYYAPRACNRRQTAGGVETYNGTADVYQYADGSWRTTAQEDFQLLSRRTLARNFDPSTGFLTGDGTYVSRYFAVEIPRGTLNPATGAEVPSDVLMTDAGVAWLGGSEVFDTEYNQTTYYQGSGNTIAKATTLLNSVTAFTYSPAANPGGAYGGLTIWFFGPTSAKKYGVNPSAPGALGQTMTLYNYINELTHQEISVFTPVNYFPASFQSFAGIGTVIVPGAVPIIEQKTSLQQSQPATVTVTNDVQTALGGGINRPDTRQNDYCETDGELRNAAIEDLRANGSPKVTIVIDVHAEIDEGSVIVVNHPNLGDGPQKLLVWTNTLTIQGGLAPNATQTLLCRWYPAELLNA